MKMHDGKELTLYLVLCQKVAGFIPDEVIGIFSFYPILPAALWTWG
jgi:hypothetical protein